MLMKEKYPFAVKEKLKKFLISDQFQKGANFKVEGLIMCKRLGD